MSRQASVLHTGGTFYESPRWLGRWIVSDVYAGQVVEIGEDGTAAPLLETALARPSGLGADPSGRLLILSAADHTLHRREDDGTTTLVASFAGLGRGMASDMVVDAVGRAYVSCTGFDLDEFDLTSGQAPPSSVLVRVDPDGSARIAADGLSMPNGMVLEEDGSTLRVAESLGLCITAFDVSPAGDLTAGRRWADLTAFGVVPDGCALDADGNLWVADAFGARCVLVAAGGTIVDEVTVPDGLQSYACTLGGADGRTLAIACAPDFDPERRAGADDAALVVIDVGAPRAGRP